MYFLNQIWDPEEGENRSFKKNTQVGWREIIGKTEEKTGKENLARRKHSKKMKYKKGQTFHPPK